MERTCTKCKETKLLQDFQKNCRNSLGFSTICKTCKSAYRQQSHIRKYDLQYNKYYAVKEADHVRKRTRKNNIRKLYGLTVEQYELMAKNQNDLCAICKIHVSKTKYPSLCIDHDHNNGNVRGLLCDTCNRAIGLLKDNPEILENASTYLRKSRTA